MSYVLCFVMYVLYLLNVEWCLSASEDGDAFLL